VLTRYGPKLLQAAVPMTIAYSTSALAQASVKSTLAATIREELSVSIPSAKVTVPVVVAVVD
jgi:hypothetical protein